MHQKYERNFFFKKYQEVLNSDNWKGVTEMVQSCPECVPELIESNINDVNK